MPAMLGSETLFIKRLESMHDIDRLSVEEFEMEPEQDRTHRKACRTQVVPLSSANRSQGKARFTKVTLSKETSFREPLSAARVAQKTPHKTFLSTSSRQPAKLPKSRASLKNSNVGINDIIRHLTKVWYSLSMAYQTKEVTTKQKRWSLIQKEDSLHSAVF